MNKQGKTSYLFNLEILIEDEHHSTALEQLLNKLNGCHFIDYKVNSGIELGKIIEQRIESAVESTSIPVTNEIQSYSNQPEAVVTPTSELEHSLEAMKRCKSQNKLIRLIVNRGLGIKLSIPCRVINVDETDLIVTVYHVDEKQVYTFRLIEIEDFIET